MNRQHRGILLMLGSFALMTGEASAVHALGESLTVFQLTVLRGLGGLILVGFLGRSIGLSVWRTEQVSLQIVRGGMTVASLWLIFYSVAHLPLPDATAIQYTRPLFLTAFAALVLREAVGPRRWLATVIGLGGGLLIIGPGLSAWQSVYLVGLVGAGVNAAAMVLTKILERRDSALTILAYLSLTSVLFSIPGLTEPWPLALWPYLLAVGVLGPLSLYLGLLAIRAADIATLAPYDYSRLLFAAGVALVAFGEVPTLSTFVGATVIAAAGVWVALSVERPAVAAK
jgi:drug/metabolite transporter (DMT)-like permease